MSTITLPHAGEPKPVQLSEQEACAILASRQIWKDPVLMAALSGYCSAMALEASNLESPHSVGWFLARFVRFHRAEIESLPKIEQHSEKSVEHQNKP